MDANYPPDPHCKAAGDLDGDGKVDLLVASASGGGLWWYHAPDWSRHLIAEGSFTTFTSGSRTAQPIGRCARSTARMERAWFDSPFDPAAWLWIEHLIAETDHTHGLAVGDIDRDGRLKIAAAKMHQASAPQEVAVYDWQDDQWQKIVLATTGSHGIRLVDLEGNGKLSVFGCNWNDHSSTGGAVELWQQV